MVHKGLLIGFMLLLWGSSFAQNALQVTDCHYSAIPFSAFSDSITKKTGVRIYYKPEWTDSLSVTIDSDSISVLNAVARALKGSGLEVSPWHGDLVIIPGVKLINSLPAYTSSTDLTGKTGAVGAGKTENEDQYLTGRSSDALKTLRIGKNGGAAGRTKAKLLGRLLDEETGEPVAGATLYITETATGAVTDAYGFLSITLKPGNYNASFEYLGYEKQKYLLEVISDGSFQIRMKKAVVQIKEVVVYGDRQAGMRTKDPGLDKIAIKSIKELPMMMGERDILKVSSLMPGIVNTGEGSAGLNVRGGSSDQNAFYINKIPIYNTSHLFGFFPAFNSDIIRDFSIYKGYIPAQYGGRLSSVFNILSRQGNRKKFMARGGISPIAGNIVLEGPLKKDTCSFLISARSTYSDWLLGRIKDPDIRSSSANFYDLSAAVNYDLRKSQLAVFAYHSNDHFRFSDLNEYSYSNNGLSAGYNHNFTNLLRGEFTLVASRYDFSTIDMQQESSAYKHTYNMDHYEARADFKHAGEKHSLEYGTGLVLYRLSRGKVTPYGSASLRSVSDLGEEKGVEPYIYISDSWEPFSWLKLLAGLRYAAFSPLGARSVYLYHDGLPRDKRYITDTLTYADNAPITWYHEPDIRLSVSVNTDPNGTIKLAYNQMHQNLFMLNTTVAIAPNTQWKLADYYIRPSASRQVSLGVFRDLPGYGLETSIEAYYKKTDGYPEFRDGADFLNEPQVEISVLQGVQQAYGVELFIKRTGQKLEGWISYTYSRSVVTVDAAEKWNRINDGMRYPANFDIPHAVNMVLNYHLKRRLTLSSVIVYQKGKPITYPVSVYFINTVPFLDYSSRNAYRIPDYFRTDLSLTLEGNLKKHKLIHNSVVFSLYNATGRKNAYSVYFSTENGSIKSYKYSVVGVPIFTVTWQFKLGNYASE